MDQKRQSRQITHRLPLVPAGRTELLEPRILMAGAPNDPYFASQYALANTGAVSAWEKTAGSAAVVVADIDTGADYSHEDLYANIWINQAEIPASVKDQLTDTDADGLITFYDLNREQNRSMMTDVNGNGRIDAGDLLTSARRGGWCDGINGKSNANDRYIDDIVGWDFAENDNNPFDDGSANEGHGTHTAGIIGAEGNNGVGISGIVQKVSLMIVRIFNDAGNAISDTRIAAAIRYSADSGARISNNSWGGSSGRNGDVLYNAIRYAGTKDQLFVTAAGNERGNLDSWALSDYPSEYDLDNILVVAATTSAGDLASYSNYGSTQVDIAAPGDRIISTLPRNRYGKLSGTSMSSPIVAGAAALILSASPSLSVFQLKQQIIEGANEAAPLYNKTVSDGQLSVSNAILGQPGSHWDAPADSSTSAGNRGEPFWWRPPGRRPFPGRGAHSHRA